MAGELLLRPGVQAIEQDLTSTLSKSFLTALTLLGDETKAETLVVRAIQSLSSGGVTSGAIRAAVIDRLVQIRISGMSTRHLI
jgi:hypothetical protein